ncbi:hypothetical protein FRACA_2390007 [Frankia canadensis]|uniref:Uncharacterized protein n=1 Tax=Frankia canadensis TaxID=1836972 RepID=A0A2I2KRR0_9ACTN|nr:hypothetical protein FRACA_2390007 [Frankia canadensis]SOU55616.1 hypothetical protein FRACA_2390007 [Frankia canadensis]
MVLVGGERLGVVGRAGRRGVHQADALDLAGEAGVVLHLLGQVRRDPRQLLQQGRAVRRAAVGIARGRPQHQPVQFRGDTLDHGGRRRHVAVDGLVGHRHRGRPAVRELAGERLEQHHPGGVDVAAGVGGAVGDLLGGEVADGTQDHAVSQRLGGLAEGPGEAEVGHLHLAVVAEQDVLGLDVAMDDPGVVGGGERLHHRLDDLDGLGDRQPAARTEMLAQRAAAHQLHHQVVHQAGGRVIGALVEDGDDAGRVQPGDGLGLAVETPDELRVVIQVGMHDLERDESVQPVVVRDVHRRHAADGKTFLRRVAAVEKPAYHRVGHGGIHGRQFTIDADRLRYRSLAGLPAEMRPACRGEHASSARRYADSGANPRNSPPTVRHRRAGGEASSPGGARAPTRGVLEAGGTGSGRKRLDCGFVPGSPRRRAERLARTAVGDPQTRSRSCARGEDDRHVAAPGW